MNRRWLALGAIWMVLTGLLLPFLPAQTPPALRPPEPLPGAGWRLTWSGETGRVYRLERSSSLPPGGAGWETVATLTATNGLIIADDLVEPAAQARFYRATWVAESPRITVGVTELAADAMVTNGTEVVLSGRIRAGVASLASAAPLVVDLGTRRLTGTGEVALTNGLSVTGTFEADLATGRLQFTGDPGPVPLGEFIRLDPRALAFDLNTGAMEGEGTFTVRLPDRAGAPAGRAATEEVAAILDGAFESQAADGGLAFAGTATYRDVVAEGTGTVDVDAGTFRFAGKVRIPGAGATPYLLEPGTMALRRHPDGSADFALAGQSALAPAGAGLLSGTLDLAGAVALTWSGPAEVGALQFPNLTVQLERPGLPGTVASLRFRGGLELPRVGGTELEGVIRPDGTTTNLVSTAPLQLGALNIRPRVSGDRTVPVLTLIRSEVNRQTLRVQGEFLTPEADGVQPVRVNGELVITGGAGGLDIGSLHVTNELPIPQWPLPQMLRLTNFSLRLTYTNADFEARLRGGLLLTVESNRPTSLELDTALVANVNDPADLGLDAALRVQSLNLRNHVFVTDAQFRMLVGTKPPFGTLTLVNGSAGLFPKFAGTNIPAHPQRANFHLFAGGVGASVTLSENGLNLSLTNGFLQLPLLFTNQPPGLCPDNSSGTSVGLGRGTAITVDISGPGPDDLTVRAQGSLNFTNIALLPQLNGFATELCRASLVFNPGGLPYLTNLQGVVVFPLPKGQTNRVELINGAWGLDGFPTGTIALMTNLRLYEGHGFRFTLLARNTANSLCTNGVALTAIRDADGGLPTLVLDGASELIVPAGLVTEVDGDFVRHVNCARITLPGQAPYLPRLDVKTVAFGGTFHLGGEGGFLLTNALFTIRNLDNLFEPTVAEPFVLELSGTLAVPNGPAFSLKEARLTQISPDQPPQFTLAGMGYSENEFTLAQKIPVRVTAVSFEFKDRNKPLPDLLKPANVNLKFSVLAALPSTEKKLFEGTVKDLKLTVKGDGLPAIEDVDGFSMLIKGLKMPPISDIGGGVLVSGLSRAAGVNRTGPARAGLFGGDLDDLFYAGTVEGSYQGYKLKLILAFRSAGIVGACLDFNAGSVGIPIDGGYLGGLLLTGASGGVALGNGFNDPCEFTSFIGPDGKPKPGITQLPKIAISWEDLEAKLAKAEEQAEKFSRWVGERAGSGTDGETPDPLDELRVTRLDSPAIARAEVQRASVFPHVRSTNEFGLPCPGDCPPPTINIFCQPHPDQDRYPRVVIARFSSINEDTLNSLGFTRSWVSGQVATGGDWATRIGLAVAAGVRETALSKTPLPVAANLGSEAAADLLAIINENAAALEAAMVAAVVEAVANESNADVIYDQLVAAAYRGAPCPDITLSVSGTFTHTAVSSFLSGTVGAAISSAGVAGLAGHINLLGVPVGNAKAFVAATDERADPNPSVCAEVDVEVGPLSFGSMRASYALQGAVTGLVNAWTRLLGCISEPLLFEIVQQVAPQVIVTGRTKLAVADELTPQEKVGVIAQLYSRPGLPGELRACVADGLGVLMADVNPEVLFCGEVRPRLFGFPLGADLMTAGMHVTKTNYTAVSAGSPTMMLATALLSVSSSVGTGTVGALAGPLSATLFAPDRAIVGFSLSYPDPAEPFVGGISGRFSSPAAVVDYLDTTFDRFLENATYTVSYTLSPLGFKTVDTQARVVLPNLTDHPARPDSGWVRPENRGLSLPSRLDLVLSALTNRLSGSSLGLLADPQWKGTAADLGEAFADGSPEQQRVAGLSFARDYFPHGGLVGGGYVQLPRALYEAPAAALYTALSPTNDAFTRLGAAAEYLFDYVLQSRQAGALGFYVPAPNPPFFTDADGAALKPRALLESIRDVRPEQPRFVGLYPGGEFFLRGFLDGQLLGIPVVKATLEARLADAATGTNAYFRAAGQVPAGSWLDAFSPGAAVELELRGAPPETLETVFSNRLAQVRAVLDGPHTEAALTSALAEVLGDLQSKLPKVKLETALPLQMPAPLSDLVRFDGGTWLYAYSPRYEPGFAPADNDPVAQVRRNGGLAMRGHLNFRLNGADLAAVADAQLRVTPAASGLPAIEGAFAVPLVNVGALAIRDARLDFSNVGHPRYGVRGSVTPLNVGAVFRLDPLTGSDLSARLEVSRVGNAAAGELFLSPSRLKFGSANYLVHGGQRTNAFTFSSTGPWSATLEVTNQLELRAGNITVLRLAPNALASPISVNGIGLNTLEFSASLVSGGTTLTVFPDSTFAQTIATKPDATARVTIRSDGTFEVAGTLNQDLFPLGLPGLSITAVKAGATFRVTEAGLFVNGQLNGGVLAQFGGPAFNAAGRFSLTPGGVPTVTTDAQLNVPSFGTPFLALQGNNGGPITATLNQTGLNLSGARLIAPGLFTNGVPAFSADAQGNFLVSVGPTGSSFSRWSFSSLSYQILRTNGVLALTNVNAISANSAFNSSLAFTGFVNSAGVVDLRAAKTEGFFGGFQLASLDVGLKRGVGNVRSAILASGPLAYWRLGEGGKTATVALSETGSKFDGAYQLGSEIGHPGALIGDANTAARFDGKGGRVVIGNESLFDKIGPALTVEAWIKVNAFDRTWNTIIAKGDSSWRLQRNGNTDVLGFDTDGLNPPYLAGSRPVNDGQWHQVVASYDGRVKSLWIDGELDAWTPATGSIAQNDFPVVLGENAQSTGRFWNGWLDEVAVYDRALTPMELLAHREAGGALVASASLRSSLPGLGSAALEGSLAANGSAALLSQPVNQGVGGFSLDRPRLQFFRTVGGTASLLVDGDLNLLGLPPLKLVGGITPAGVVSLTGTLGSGSVLGFGFTDLAGQLTGTTATASLGLGGKLAISGLGTLGFSGMAAANGDLALTNTFATSTPIFGYPASSGRFVLRREGRNYRTLITGEPLVSVDRGDDPRAYWRLGETAGPTAADSKKANFANPALPGSYVGGVTLGTSGALAGDANLAAGFDGVNDYVEIANESAFDDLTGRLTVEVWMKSPGWTRTWETLISKGDSSWRLSRFGNSRQVSFDTSSAAGAHSLAGTSNLDDNRWHHVVGVFDGYAKYLYVDGILEAFAPYRQTILQNDFPVRLGENAQATGRYFRGQLDEVAIYPRALSPLEVLDHYRAGGGAGLDVALRFALPGLGGVDTAGLLHPSGAMSVQAAAGSTIPLTGFSLGSAVLSVTRTATGSVDAVLGGSVATPLGTLQVAGSVPGNGNYVLESAAVGSLTVGDRVLSYSTPARLTKAGLEASGQLGFGEFGFTGKATVSTSAAVSFAGSISNVTAKLPFGRRLDGRPGHPYAWLTWTAAATYDGPSQKIKATVGGDITVEYEVFPGNTYRQETVGFPALNLPEDGRVTIQPGKSFPDYVQKVNVSSFPFDLP